MVLHAAKSGVLGIAIGQFVEQNRCAITAPEPWLKKTRAKRCERGNHMASVAQLRNEYVETSMRTDEHSHGVTWSAIAAGAFATAALSLILLALGTGMGLSAISTWSGAGLSPAGVGAAAIVWLIVVQIIASAIGGYLTGRLRVKWVAVHTHEVFFRDTAHGFLVWAVGLVISAMFFAMLTAAMATSVVRNGSGNSGEGAAAAGNGYFVDSLFRADRPTTEPNDSLERAEAGAILVHALRQTDLSAQDKAYLAQLVAARTGLDQTAAEQRVSDTVAAAREDADNARKAVAHMLYWLFVALLIGAFCASFAATIGGRQRDHVPVV
jgi:hypothetical protein